MIKNIFLVSPRGFCAGVRRALATVEYCLKNYKNQKIYVYHDIVHNTHVVNDFKKRGIIFVEDINLIPKNSIVIFSAHGVAKNIVNKAQKRNLKIIDATCPLVTKIHKKAEAFAKKNHAIILIGHKNHPEVIGTLGQLADDENTQKIFVVENVTDAQNFDVELVNCFTDVSCLTQTTFSIDKINIILETLKNRITNLTVNNDICYATTNRQDAVKNLAQKCGIVFVVGSQHSSNSQRLCELANEYTLSFLIEDYNNLDKLSISLDEIKDINNIGITAGASAPEFLVTQLIERLQQIFSDNQNEINIEEIHCDCERHNFSLPIINF